MSIRRSGRASLLGLCAAAARGGGAARDDPHRLPVLHHDVPHELARALTNSAAGEKQGSSNEVTTEAGPCQPQ